MSVSSPRTRNAFITFTARRNCRTKSGVSSPWNCSVSIPDRTSTSATVRVSASTKSPTRAMNGGSSRTISPARSGEM